MKQPALPGFALECQLCHAKPPILIFVQDVAARLCLPCFYARYPDEYAHLLKWVVDHVPEGEEEPYV